MRIDCEYDCYRDLKGPACERAGLSLFCFNEFFCATFEVVYLGGKFTWLKAYVTPAPYFADVFLSLRAFKSICVKEVDPWLF